ncbi:S1/P1 nuclease [Massilia sp. H6]|uniref:S1/P1 nuclease n=1 Tax=Massilia sp. H6 TaxID=2970464 RepID=UPI00216A8A00|nr:S1/P1 nuclease [Massilia sp. H6]UVW29586.1 S1/P1 nuclease [Massilia sp. H6]
MKKLAVVLALTGAFASFDAMAWGRDGHKAIGAIADKLLKGTNAQKEINLLLKPGESLELVANWADCVRGTFCGEQTQEMLDYVSANPQHDKYHYTNVPFQHDHYDDHGVGRTGVDIVQTLRQCIAVLQGKLDPELNPHKFTRRQALILIAHFAGDIHQPLHVGAAYVGKDSKFVVPPTQADVNDTTIYDSRGSNNLLLDDARLGALATAAAIPPGEPVPMREGGAKSLTKPFHSYWDSTTVDYAFRRLQTSTPDAFATKVIGGNMTIPQIEGDPIAAPFAWANHSLFVAKQAFAGVVPGKMVAQTNRKGETYYAFTLDVPANYPVPSSEIAKQQLIKGGYNLAALLQAIWPEKG